MQNIVREGFRLSPQQRYLWSLQQAAPARPFRSLCAILIGGGLEQEVLRCAVENVVRSHEILRTTFHRPPGIKTPFQVVSEKPLFSWQEVELSNLDSGQQEAKIERLFEDERKGLFDLAEGPLLRVLLLRLSDDRYVLILSLPALCADSRTLSNLVSEIGQSYELCLNRQPRSDGPMQYADFAEWQNELLEADDKDAEQAKNYWKKHEALSTPGLVLPLEKRSSESRAFEPDSVPFVIDADVASKIEMVARGHEISTSNFLFTCWQALMWRLTGQPEFVISYLCDGRKFEDLRGALGLYAKYLPIRCRCDDGLFGEYLAQTGRTIAEVAEWQEYFDPGALRNRESLTPASTEFVAFEFEERPMKHSAGGICFSMMKQFVCIGPFKIKICFLSSGESLYAELQYNRHVFDRELVERIGAYFQRVLAQVIRNPQVGIETLEILGEDERRRLLVEFNETAADYPADQCVHELFEDQVNRKPDATAVVCEDKELSYSELNARANQLAHLLQKRGVGPNSRVGLCMERSADMIVGLLGILKAGGAYVPLNPDHPKARLELQLRQSEASICITKGSDVGPLESSLKVIDLDRDQIQLKSEPTCNPETIMTPENLVYVIYTSGSTGIPKGVAVRHQSLVNYTHFIRNKLGNNDRLSFATVSTISADLGNTCIFPSLVSGGCLHIIVYDTAMEARLFSQYIAKRPIDVLKIVPSHLNTLLASQEDGNVLPSKYLITGGEALPWELLERISRTQHTCKVINHYGPTETTVGSLTFNPGENEVSPYSLTVPIGRPVANTRLYILDNRLRPVPVGVAGELYIGGPGVAEGYLNEPSETAMRFMPDPFSGNPAERLYKTGDLARHLPDGLVEFLGRVDHQVKLRGFRVELGEIEAVLAEHLGVRQAVAMVRRDASGDERLVAYLIASGVKPPSQNDLRSLLKQRLPDYMVPSTFVFLKSLPLTSNGKVDRAALPAPDDARPELQKIFVAPRTSVEKETAAIWAAVLRLNQVGIHDNFFDLGGHSLLATQVISRLRQTFQLELPLRSLFEAPTVASLVQRIETARRASQEIKTAPISPVSRETQLPLSFAQQRLWLLDQFEPGSCTYNVPRAVRVRGALRHDALQRALDALVARHESLRTTFVTVEGNPVQVIAESGSVHMPLIDLTDLSEAARDMEAESLITNEAQRSFDLAQGPLFRASLVRLAVEEHILLLNNHHIVSDGWSAGILFEELALLYKAFSLGQPSPLVKLPIQYADYAVWQREWLQGEVLEQELNYWKQQLDGAPALLELLLDRPRPAVQTHRGGCSSLMLPTDLTRALRTLSQREGTTLFMTLLAALQLMLARLSGQDDIVVGSPIAGRTRAELERLIGFFLNTLVLRTKLSGDPTFRDLLLRVREVALGAYAHQDIPFERLIEELQPERNLSHTPLFQVFLNMVNFSANGIELPGLIVEHLPTPEIGSKFDLTLYVVEQDDAIVLQMLYNADLFDEASITRMLAHFRTLLEGVVVNPELPISNYALRSEVERYQDSIRGNISRPVNLFTTFEKEEIEQSISDRFERQVSKYPRKVAVRSKNHEWSYEELNRATNRVAHSILTLRGEVEERIALLFEHDAPMIAGLLGTLKAGKTYVPLDPSYPRERLAFMLRDSQAGALLTDDKNLALARELTTDRLPLINIDSVDSAAPVIDINRTVQPSGLAYVLYTSGSTGQPKGVMQNHRNVLHFIRVYTNNLHISADDRLTLLSSYCFDAAVMDIYGALLNGATLYPIDIKEEGLVDLSEWLSAQEITIYHSTPTVYRYFVNTLSGESDFHRLRLVVLGGEEVNRRDVELYKKHFSDESLLVNGLGPTEATVSLQYFIDKQTEISGQAVPVGYPVEDTEILLLNAAGKPAEIYGEIAIRCEHVALGYWRNAEATDAAFLSDWQGAGSRTYRTGDMGRRLPDGSIEFEGRKDFQVKIRGFRVELGEIESALAEHPGLRENVVLARQNESGEKNLVAYVVPLQESVITTTELRRYLSEKLPDYMRPAAFVIMKALPLTPNGKVDRGALPAPEHSRPELEGTFVAPRTPVEEVVAGIWTEVLGLERVGIHDNFFDLGGHSLLATQVMSRVRETFRVDLPLRRLFESSTVASLALAIGHSRDNLGENDTIEKTGSREDLLSQVDRISDREVDALLGGLLAEKQR